MKALNNECARDAVNFIYKNGDLTYGSAYDAIQLLTSNGFAIYRTDGDEQVVYTDTDGKVWHPHRGYWCWKVSSELTQAQERIKELEAELAGVRFGAVNVCELEWHDKSIPIMRYFAECDEDGRWRYSVSGPKMTGPYTLKRYGVHCDEYPSITAAKAAAQADYERRILSALSPAPEAQQEPEKIDLSVLDAWFPNGVPVVAVKIMFPEKSQPLTTAEVRHVLAALASASRPEQAVTEEMVEAATQAWLESASDYPRLHESIRAALKAAMEAGR